MSKVNGLGACRLWTWRHSVGAASSMDTGVADA